jgi:hypothetical protein
MKAIILLLVVGAAAWFAFQFIGGSGGPDLTFKGDEVLLATGDLDVRFSRGKSFEETYMVFGGAEIEHENAVANVTMAGLSLRDAKPIYRRYPDFHRCTSPGANFAKERVVQLDMVPANGETQAQLSTSLAEFDDNIRSGGDRVCVRLSGSKLTLESAEIREAAQNVTDTFRTSKFYLVDSADAVNCQEALGGT